MSQFLTSPTRDLPAPAAGRLPPPVFGLPVRTLSLVDAWLSPATGVRLAAEIGRHPANLHLHVQRIALWHRLDDAGETCAAVLDLWIVLGSCGVQLRARMLRTHRAALDARGIAAYLERRLESGVDRHDPLVALPGVVLARPVRGRRIFLRRHATHAPPYRESAPA